MNARPQVFDRDTVAASIVVRPTLDGRYSIVGPDGAYAPRSTESGAIEAARAIHLEECATHGLGRVLLASDPAGDSYADVTEVSK